MKTSKVKATCHNCEKTFVLPGIEVDIESFNNGALNNPMLGALYFACLDCRSLNTFSFDELSLAD